MGTNTYPDRLAGGIVSGQLSYVCPACGAQQGGPQPAGYICPHCQWELVDDGLPQLLATGQEAWRPLMSPNGDISIAEYRVGRLLDHSTPALEDLVAQDREWARRNLGDPEPIRANWIDEIHDLQRELEDPGTSAEDRESAEWELRRARWILDNLP